VSTVPELWHLHAERDRNNPNLNFPELVESAPPGIEAELTAAVYQRKHEVCQRAIAALGDALNEIEVDAVVVIGDDQHELFREECLPAFAIYTGADLVDIPTPIETAHPSHVPALWSRHNTFVEKYPTAPALATHLTASIMRQGFDIATAAKQYDGRGLGHAYTFVRLRLMRDRVVPIVPVFINCYFPPNQPSPDRCFLFGKALRRAIDEWPHDRRIAIVASGGLTHFVIDEAVDRRVLLGIGEKRCELLRNLPAEKLNSGSSEIRNWIAAAGALEDFPATILDYVPAYRSAAGTGCGMAFVRWGPNPRSPAPDV
jgi:Catalytic LigB subunit of aromatic ring-opening dioxygenase